MTNDILIRIFGPVDNGIDEPNCTQNDRTIIFIQYIPTPSSQRYTVFTYYANRFHGASVNG